MLDPIPLLHVDGPPKQQAAPVAHRGAEWAEPVRRVCTQKHTGQTNNETWRRSSMTESLFSEGTK